MLDTQQAQGLNLAFLVLKNLAIFSFSFKGVRKV